jgi:hypothetical protein
MEQGPDELSEREESRGRELDKITNEPLDAPGSDDDETDSDVEDSKGTEV